jgi:hypothetical protein
MSADKTAVAHFRPNMNVMFVTDGVILPFQIGSDLANADKLCADSAAAAFLGGSRWSAWLATSAATTNINAASHVGASTTGWIRVDGRPFATSMTNLLAGKIFYPPDVTEKNTFRKQAYAVATGTTADGVAIPNGTCGDWTSSTGSTYNGDATSTTSNWSYEFSVGGDSCGNSLTPVYCFQNDTGMAAVAAPVIPATARHAFKSKTTWMPGGGVAAADVVCQSDATAAGLANATNYRALLTTTVAATAATRISVTGEPWFRLDGAQLVATAADLAAPAADRMLTALNVDPTGAYGAATIAWTGSAVAPSDTSMIVNCNNWSTSAATVSAWRGVTIGSNAGWWAGNMQACNVPSYLYCFER